VESAWKQVSRGDCSLEATSRLRFQNLSRAAVGGLVLLVLLSLGIVEAEFEPETSMEEHKTFSSPTSVNASSPLIVVENHDTYSSPPEVNVSEPLIVPRHRRTSSYGSTIHAADSLAIEQRHNTSFSPPALLHLTDPFVQVTGHVGFSNRQTLPVTGPLDQNMQHTTKSPSHSFNLTNSYLVEPSANVQYHSTNTSTSMLKVQPSLAANNHHLTNSTEQTNNVSAPLSVTEHHLTSSAEQTNNVSAPLAVSDQHNTCSSDQTINVSLPLSGWQHHTTNSTPPGFGLYIMVNLSLEYNYTTQILKINSTARCTVDGTLTESNTTNVTYEILGTRISGNLSWDTDHWENRTNLSSLSLDVYEVAVRFEDNNSHKGSQVEIVDTRVVELTCEDNAHRLYQNATTTYTIIIKNNRTTSDTYILSSLSNSSHFTAHLNMAKITMTSGQSTSVRLTVKSLSNSTVNETGNITVFAVSENSSDMKRSVYTLATVVAASVNLTLDPSYFTTPTPILQQKIEEHRDPKYSYTGEKVSNGTLNSDSIYAKIYTNRDGGGPGIMDMWNKQEYPNSTANKPHDVMWYGDYDYVSIDGEWQPQESNGTIIRVNETIAMVIFDHRNYTLYKIFEALPDDPVIRVTFEIVNKDNTTHNYTLYYANDFCRGGSGGSKYEYLYLYNSTTKITESGWFSIYNTTALVSRLNVGGTGGEDWTMLANFEPGAQFYAGKWTNAVNRNWTIGDNISSKDSSVGVKFPLGEILPNGTSDVIYYIGTTNSHAKIDKLIESCVTTKGHGIKDVYVKSAYNRYYAGTNVTLMVDTLSVKQSMNGTVKMIVTDSSGKEYLNQTVNVSMVVNQTATTSFTFSVPYEYGKKFDAHVYLYNSTGTLVSYRKESSLIPVFGILAKVQNTGELTGTFSVEVDPQSPIETKILLPSSISSTNITLKAGESIFIPIKVIVPSNATPGKYNITVSAKLNRVPASKKNVTAVLMVPSKGYAVHLNKGWNFISFPLFNQTLNASSLVDRIGKNNVTMIKMFNETSGNDIIYNVSKNGPNGFPILPTRGYWIYCTNATTITINGSYTVTINETLSSGWHSMGWSTTESIKASEIPNYLDTAKDVSVVVTTYNRTEDRYHSYIVDFSESADDFEITMGDAFWLYVDSNVNFNVKGEG